MTFEQGQRVTTPVGPGSVVDQRLAGPDYTQAEAVSVVLDARCGEPHYAGTMFAAGQVKSDARAAEISRLISIANKAIASGMPAPIALAALETHLVKL